MEHNIGVKAIYKECPHLFNNFMLSGLVFSNFFPAS